MKNNSHIKNIVILHGWGVEGAKYKELNLVLSSKGYKVFAPDLPGFGLEPLFKQGRDRLLDKENDDVGLILDDYVLFLINYLRNNKIKNCILVGHSFGTRIIVKFISEYNLIDNFLIKGIVLSGAPLINHQLSFKKKIGVLISKSGKKILELMPNKINKNEKLFRKFVYKLIGEWDYYKSGNLRKTFVNIINTKLENNLSKIKIPTLILWGKNDKITPLQDAFKIEELIKDSKLVVIENGSHKLPYENAEVFANEVLNFIKKL